MKNISSHTCRDECRPHTCALCQPPFHWKHATTPARRVLTLLAYLAFVEGTLERASAPLSPGRAVWLTGTRHFQQWAAAASTFARALHVPSLRLRVGTARRGACGRGRAVGLSEEWSANDSGGHRDRGPTGKGRERARGQHVRDGPEQVANAPLASCQKPRPRQKPRPVGRRLLVASPWLASS